MNSTAIVLSLFPAVFWLLYLRSLAHYRSYRPFDFLLALSGGALSPTLVFLAADWVLGGSIPNGIWKQLYFFVVHVGWVEELAKLLFAALFLRLAGRLREPIDGLLLGGCLALGFATSENVVYIQRAGESVLLGRSILATFGHVLMSSFWAYPLGQPGWKGLPAGLLAASVVHGFYDWFLVIGWPSLAILTLIGAWSVFRFRVVHANLDSDQRVLKASLVRECAHCAALTRYLSRYCSNCGKVLGEPLEPGNCSECLERQDGDTTNCHGCGRAFIEEEFPEQWGSSRARGATSKP